MPILRRSISDFLLLCVLIGCSKADPTTWPDPTPRVQAATGVETATTKRRPWKLESFARVDADPDNGFHWPYYLFVPAEIPSDGPVRLLVEPNNSGRPSDDQDFHDAHARRQAFQGTANQIARRLKLPLLVPVFPRPMAEAATYTHALDRDTLLVRDGTLVRVDEQLLRMVDDARQRLRGIGVETRDRIFMTGFSATGNFVNRFAVLHPRRVRAVATGAVNGMPIIPATERNGASLRFPIGLADIEEITGDEVDMAAYRSVCQMIYMGYLDRVDTLLYRDAYDEEDATLTRETLGASVPARWEASQKIYEQLDVPAQFVTYDGLGHDIRPEVIEDIVEFLAANEGPGCHEIAPHRYPFVEFRELEKVTVVDTLWRGDRRIPERFRHLSGGTGDFVLLVEEWIPQRDHHQLRTFRTSTPIRLELRAPNRKTIALTQENIIGNVASGDGSFQGFIVHLGAENEQAMAVRVPYRIHVPRGDGGENKWVIRGQVAVTRTGLSAGKE